MELNYKNNEVFSQLVTQMKHLEIENMITGYTNIDFLQGQNFQIDLFDLQNSKNPKPVSSKNTESKPLTNR